MHSLTKILHSLLTGGHRQAVSQMKEDEESRKEVTSIRLKPQTRAYLQAQSEALGISVSQLINIIIDGVVSIETSPQESRIDSIYDRLMLVFESHGIAPLDMSRMLSQFGITLSTLKSRDATLDLISPELLAGVTRWFGVNQHWLTAATAEEVYPTRKLSWYKSTENFAATLIERCMKHHKVDIYVIKNAGVSFEDAELYDDNAHYLGMGILLRYEEKVSDVSFSRYELCEFQRWNYDRCRKDLKLLLSFFEEFSSKNHSVRIHGCSVNEPIFDRIYQGRITPDHLEKSLRQAEWWDTSLFKVDIAHEYKGRKFSRYLTAYLDSPYKTFTQTYNKYNSPDKLIVKVWDKDVEHQYNWFTEALEDIYKKYHAPIEQALPVEKNSGHG